MTLIKNFIENKVKTLVIINDYKTIKKKLIQIKKLIKSGSDVILSLDTAKETHSLGGAVILTDNNKYAHKFRNIRSSYGVLQKEEVIATCNGRFSELQALYCIDYLEKIKERIL